MRIYEQQLDQRIQAVQANNRRLLELKSMIQEHNLVLSHQDGIEDDDELSLDEEEEEMERVDRLEREKERLELEEARIMLDQSNLLQQQLREDLDRERATTAEHASKVQELSVQAQALLSKSEKYAQDLETSRQQAQEAAQERLRFEKEVEEAQRMQRELQSTLDSALTGRELDQGNDSKLLVSENTALRRQLQELKHQMAQQEEQNRAAIGQHVHRNQKLERDLQKEKDLNAEDQEARSRVRARVDELVRTLESKEDQIAQLQTTLEKRDDLLDRRQRQLDASQEEVHSLRVQLEVQEADGDQDLQQMNDQHKKELKHRQTELKEIIQELTLEKESNRKHQNRIQILLESQQESSQLSDAKIRQLQEELDQQRTQLTKSATSSVASVQAQAATIHELELQLEDQQHLLVEKDDRIQQVERERDMAQQQARSAVEDMDLDIKDLQAEFSKMSKDLTRARQALDEERNKVVELDNLLNHKEEDLIHLQQHQQWSRQNDGHQVEFETNTLQDLLVEVEEIAHAAAQMMQEHEEEDGHDHDHDHDEGHRPVPQPLTAADVDAIRELPLNEVVTRLQDKVRGLKQEHLELLESRSYQDEYLEQQRRQLEQCDGDMETMQDQMQRMEQDRQAMEDQQRLLQQDLDLALERQQQLTQQVQQKDKRIAELSSSARSSRRDDLAQSTSTRRQQQEHQQQLDSLLAQLEEMESERNSLLDKMQLNENMIQDQTEAAKAIRAQYATKVEAMKAQIIKHRKTVVHQEGQLFLYLSVIEKLKLQLREGEKAAKANHQAAATAIKEGEQERNANLQQTNNTNTGAPINTSNTNNTNNGTSAAMTATPGAPAPLSKATAV